MRNFFLSQPTGWFLSRNLAQFPLLLFGQNRIAQEEGAMLKRRRSKQQTTLQDRLAAWATEARNQAAQLPEGPERDALLKKESQADNASRLEEWVSSAGSAPPK